MHYGNRPGWQYFNTREEISAWLTTLDEHSFDVTDIKWDGPGWYYYLFDSQRCPRNCCYDQVIRVYPAARRIYDLKEEMQHLADELRAAREKEQDARRRLLPS
jgi:hypothetical protein